jgi:hypothetical protein
VVTEGYSFIIAPPPPGQYEIAWTVKLSHEPEHRANVATIVVEAPQVIEPSSEPTGETTATTEPEQTVGSVPSSLTVDGSAEAASPEVEAVCTAEVATENAVRSEDPELIGPAVEAVIAAAPDDATRAIVQAVADTFQAGGPEFFEAYADLVDYVRANCGFAELDILASEYAFSGIPAELPAGPMVISFENIGSEVHQMTFIRFNDDVTLTPEELFALPVEQQQSLATFHGMFYAYPGDYGARIYDLAPGRYVAICDLPENADPEIMRHMEAPGTTEPEDADFGPPHYTLGMIHEFNAT